MKLALFDLDHTLIPFDSGIAWTRFLAERGLLPATAADDYLACCQRYVAGTLDIRALQRALLVPLAACPPAQLELWGQAFGAAMVARLPAAMRALVRQHQDKGHLCAIVTATPAPIARPFGRLFGIDHLLASEVRLVDGNPGGRLSGEIAGEPCHGEHKLRRVLDWLSVPPRCCAGGLAAVERSWFYADSASDLPLLCAVSDPVAVRPDAGLRAHARQAGWAMLD